MAHIKTAFVATVLLFFSCSFLIGCAQQHEDDYSAEVRFANWQSTKTSRARNGAAPSLSNVKNSSPDLATRNRPGTQSSHADEVTPQYERQEEPLRREPEAIRQRSRTRLRAGSSTIERRTDEVTEAAQERRRPNKVRTTESTTSNPEPITPRLRVPLQEAPLKLPKGFSVESRRQRMKHELSTTEIIPSSSPRSLSRGRVKAKVAENPRKSVKEDDISESDNYPPGFVEKLKKSEEKTLASAKEPVTTPRRSRLRQRAAKSYPAIAISEANRFRQRYTRISPSTDKPQEEVTTEETTVRKDEFRQRSRVRYTTSRTTTENKPKPFRNYGRRLAITEKNENATRVPTTTISPRQKYLTRLRSSNKNFKSTTEKAAKKEEALEPAENLFYVYPEGATAIGEGNKQKMKNIDGDLETEASEEDKMVETSKATEKVKEITAATAVVTTTSTTTTAATPTTVQEQTGASPSTRHRFSSRFNRSNKTTIPDEVTTIFPALVADPPPASPLNLTSLFDDSPDTTLSVMTLYNNSFAASSTVTNKTISPQSTTTTIRPSTVNVNSSTNSPTNTTTKLTKKKSRNKKSKKSNKTTTASPLGALNDRPILRNLVSLFAGPETTTEVSGRKKTSKTTKITTTTTAGPQEIAKIQSYINETMKLVQNKTGIRAQNRVVPRLALNTFTSETSLEENTTRPTTTKTVGTTTTTAASKTTTTRTTTAASKKTTASTATTAASKTAKTASTTTTAASKTAKTASTTTTAASKTAKTASTTTTAASKTAKTASTTTTAATKTPTTSTTTTTAASKIIATAKTSSLTKTSTPSSKSNCTSQFVYFDYNSTAPIPKQFVDFQEARRKAATTSSTTTSTTADYFVYGVYPNNTIVRKRAWKAFDYEKYHSPYVIFGIYPNNTIVKKFPNGTIINDEYMTSDNEVRDPTSTTPKPVATTQKQEKTTSGMKMAGSETTENRVEDEGAVTTESPDSMYEIIGNEFEKDERNDEEFSATTEAFGEDGFQFEVPKGSTTETGDETTTVAATTTQGAFRLLEDIEATTKGSREGKSFFSNEISEANIFESTTEKVSENTPGDRESTTLGPDENIVESTTEKVVTTENSRDDNSFLLNDVLGENIVDGSKEALETTTEKSTEDRSFSLNDIFSGSEIESTTENTLEYKSFSFSGVPNESAVESTTEKAGTTTESSERKSLEFNDIFGVNVESTTESSRVTTERRKGDQLLDFSGDIIDGTTEKSGTTTESNADDRYFGFSDVAGGNTGDITTEKEATTTESNGEDKFFDLFSQNIVGSTTEKTETATENHRKGKNFRINDLFNENTLVSTTEEIGTTTESNRPSLEDNGVENTTGKTSRVTESTPAGTTDHSFARLEFDSTTTTERSEPRTDIFDFDQLFQLTTTRYDSSLSNFDLRLGDGPVYRPPTTEAAEATTAARSLFGVYEDSSFPSETPPTISGLASTTTETPTTAKSLFGASEKGPVTATSNPFDGASDTDTFSSTEGRNTDETTTVSDILNEVVPFDAELFQQPDITTGSTKSAVELDESSGIVNLAFRALGSSDTITPSQNYITSTMKSTNYAVKKVKMKMKKTSTSTPKPEKENVFVVTPETTAGGWDFEFTKKAKVKFVTLTPGVIVTTNFRDGNDVMTMSSQHVQKVTKAPANLPDNVLKSVVEEIQEKSSSPIPDIIKNVEKELQGNGISVSLARRIIEMAIERTVTTDTPQTTETTPYASATTQQTTTPFTTTTNEVSTVYSDLLNTVNPSPLSVGFASDYSESTTKMDEISTTKKQTTTLRTTTKPSKKTKLSRNPAAAMSTLSENDKLLLEAILKQQNSDLSVQEIDKIIENQIRLAEEVRKASKNLKKKPRVTTTTTTTTTTQTPPLFGFLISLFSGNSSPSNIPVTRAPIKQTRSRVKSNRARGSMTNTPKSINPDPLKEAEENNSSGERSTRGELVTAAIDVTKAVSKFMGTFLSSAAQSFQAFFSNFGRGR